MLLWRPSDQTIFCADRSRPTMACTDRFAHPPGPKFLANSTCSRPTVSLRYGSCFAVIWTRAWRPIDITTTRAVAMQNHPPRIIFFLLGGLSLVSSLLMGYVMCGTKVRSWFYPLLVAATMSLTLYVILDLEYPCFGLIRIDAADQVLIELRRTMR